MRTSAVLACSIVLFLVTGCGHQQHPNYSALQHVPGSEMTSVKKAIQNAPVKQIELPTKLPFKVTTAKLQTSIQTMKQTKRFMLWMSGSKEALSLTVFPDAKNQLPSKQVFHMPNEKTTHLTDGKKALYGNNGHASMLTWAQNGSYYTISSMNSQNKADLTEQQLIKVADSFS